MIVIEVLPDDHARMPKLGVPHQCSLTDAEGVRRVVRMVVLYPATKRDYLDFCQRMDAEIPNMDELDRATFYWASID